MAEQSPPFDPAEFLNALMAKRGFTDMTLTNSPPPDMTPEQLQDFVNQMGDEAESEQEAEAIHQWANRLGVISPFATDRSPMRFVPDRPE